MLQSILRFCSLEETLVVDANAAIARRRAARMDIGIFHYLYVDSLMPLAGLHFCVGLDFVTRLVVIFFK
jgi:hypothetical protein